ncbi:MAG: hypothetical protein JO364_11665 [Pseudonocardiales bacterium]|nr:hypothetical protein [Pseudonocardiales bacterium]
MAGPRGPVGITDVGTLVEPLVTDEAAAGHPHSGRYLAVCGAQVTAATLTAPGGFCPAYTGGAP